MHCLDGESQLGSDSIGRGDQQRVLEPGRLQVEYATEAANRGIGAGACGRPGEWLDFLNQALAGIDVYPGILVCRRAVRSGLADGILRGDPL